MDSPTRNMVFFDLTRVHDLIEKHLQKKKQQLGRTYFPLLPCFLAVFMLSRVLVSSFQTIKMTRVGVNSLLFRPAAFFGNLFEKSVQEISLGNSCRLTSSHLVFMYDVNKGASVVLLYNTLMINIWKNSLGVKISSDFFISLPHFPSLCARF